jgi:hypothetical protein
MYHAVTHDPDGPRRSADERKERVLHTRIPAVLEQELKRFADNLRVPVSNLVRTILEDALTVADRATGRVEEELQAAARVAADGRETLRTRWRPRSVLDEVFGFQPVVLAQDTRCAGCGGLLARGAEGWLGLRDVPGPRVIACAACIPQPDAAAGAAPEGRRPAGRSPEAGDDEGDGARERPDEEEGS